MIGKKLVLALGAAAAVVAALVVSPVPSADLIAAQSGGGCADV